MSASSPPAVDYVGEFAPHERAFLERQFSRCRFRLLARSTVDPRVAVIVWEGSGPARGGPGPLFAVPRQAAYVLDASAGAAISSAPTHGADTPINESLAAMPEARDSRPRPTGVGPEIDLVPIASAADLAARYSGHFDVAHLKLPRRNRLRGLLWRLLPALMAAVAGAWLALAIRAWLAAG